MYCKVVRDRTLPFQILKIGRPTAFWRFPTIYGSELLLGLSQRKTYDFSYPFLKRSRSLLSHVILRLRHVSSLTLVSHKQTMKRISSEVIYRTRARDKFFNTKEVKNVKKTSFVIGSGLVLSGSLVYFNSYSTM